MLCAEFVCVYARKERKNESGSIKPGKITELVYPDDKFNIDTVILEGEICWFEEEKL